MEQINFNLGKTDARRRRNDAAGRGGGGGVVVTVDSATTGDTQRYREPRDAAAAAAASAAASVPNFSLASRGKLRPSAANGSAATAAGGSDASDRAWWSCCALLVVLVLGGLVAIGVLLANSGHHHSRQTTTTTTAGGGVTVVPAGATPAPATAAGATALPGIVLSALCNVVRDDGSCLAVFSYRNTHADGAADGVDLVAAGSADNRVQPRTLPEAQAQPSVFARGYHYGGASYAWPCDAAAFTRWTLRDTTNGAVSSALLPRAAVRCPTLSEALAAHS